MNAELVKSLPPVPKKGNPRKPCYRCTNMTDVSAEEMRNGQDYTTCEHCKDVLGVTANRIGLKPERPKRRPNCTRF